MFKILIENYEFQKFFSRSQVPTIGEHIRLQETGRFYTVHQVEWQYFKDSDCDVIVYVL